MEKEELLRIIVEKNYNINNEALDYLIKNNVNKRELYENLNSLPSAKLVITLKDVQKFDLKRESRKKDLEVSATEVPIIKQNVKPSIKQMIAINPPEIEILLDIPEKAFDKPDISTFRKLFQDRYHRLRAILLTSINDRTAILSQNLTKNDIPESREGILIGMVQDTRVLHTNRFVVQLEDFLTGITTNCVMVEESKSFPNYRNIIRDTVVGIRGVLPKDYVEGPIYTWWGKDIIRPGVTEIEPETIVPFKGNVLIIGDIHFGSKYFSRSIYTNLVKFLNLESQNQELVQLAEKINTLIIAGDLIDGIGHFKNQKTDLSFKNLQSQYEELAKLLKKLPEKIEIIIIPGEHDATQTALPQPSIDKIIASSLLNLSNLRSFSNPLRLKINGRNILVYHGNGLTEILEKQFKLKSNDYFTGLKHLLEYRHLHPEYGSFYPIAPSEKDYLVIDDIPDVMVVGHFHQAGFREYKGINIILPGTFLKSPEKETSGNFPIYCADKNSVKMVNLKEI